MRRPPVRRKVSRQARRKRTAPAPAPAPLPAPLQQRVLDLQRGAGNAAVSRALSAPGVNPTIAALQRAAAAPAASPGAPAVGEGSLVLMRMDVDRITELLKKQILWAAEEQEIVKLIQQWADRDLELHAQGTAGTPYMDKLLLLLKTRTFPRATARSAWQETWVNAYDTLWYELEDERLDQFKFLATRSRKQGTAGPGGEQSENFWATLGKQEALGVWGTLKGMGLTFSGVADAVIWAQWKTSGLPLRVVLEQFGVKLDQEPPQLSPWLGRQYDDVAGEMGRAFGIDPAKDQTLLGQSSYEIGEFGGKVVGNLTLAGAGGGGAGTGVQGALKGAQLLQALQAVDQSSQKIFDRIIEIREANPNATWGDILLDAHVLMETASILGNVLSVFGTFSDATPALGDAFKKMGIPVALAQLAPQLQKAWLDWNDPKLAADPEKRDAALRDDAAAILSAVLVLIGGTVDDRQKSAEGGGGGDKGGEGNKGGEGGGGGGGGGGEGGESPFGPPGGDLGGELLEPHPVDPETGQAKVDPDTGKSVPEVVPETGPAVDQKLREQLLEGGGGELGEPEPDAGGGAAGQGDAGQKETAPPAEQSKGKAGPGPEDEITAEIRVPDELRAGQGEKPKPSARLIDRSTPDRYLVSDSSNPRFQAEGHLENGELSLTLRSKLESGERSSVIRGEEQFKAILNHFSGQTEGIRGAWSYGSNLEAFNNATAAGLPPEQAAFQTWTGGNARDSGFTTVEVRHVEGTPGKYTKVDVVFRRPQ